MIRIFGGSDGDTIIGSTEDDMLYGVAGDDTIINLNGADWVESGAATIRFWGRTTRTSSSTLSSSAQRTAEAPEMT